MLNPKLVFASLAGLSIASAALAAPLNIVLPSQPDITTQFISSNFNNGTRLFTATGTALQYVVTGSPVAGYAITGGTFTLSATISTTGVISAATLSIAGTIPALSGATSPLLTANLTSFGFGSSPLTQIFEFTGPVTGGSQASRFGTTAGVILNLGGGFAGNFTSNFGSPTAAGNADTGRIPAPGASTLVLAAGGFALARRRR